MTDEETLAHRIDILIGRSALSVEAVARVLERMGKIYRYLAANPKDPPADLAPLSRKSDDA